MRSPQQFLQAGSLVPIQLHGEPQPPARQPESPRVQPLAGLHIESVQELFAGEYWATCSCGAVSPACDRREDAAVWRCDYFEADVAQAVNHRRLSDRMAVAQFARVTAG